jgi:hypothetical protein
MSDDKKYVSFDEMMKEIDEKMSKRTRWQRIKDSIRWDVLDKIETFCYDLKYFIKDIFIYAPMLWKNREYDYEHLISFMIFKLKRMERLHRVNGHLECSIETADEIKTFIARLERLLTWEEFIDYDNLDTDAYIRLMQAQEQEYKDVFRDLGERIQSFWD